MSDQDMDKFKGRVQMSECDKCMRDAPLIKKQLTPEIIDELAKSERKKCELIPEEKARDLCIAKVMQFVDQATYMLTHSATEFCEYVGACP